MCHKCQVRVNVLKLQGTPVCTDWFEVTDFCVSQLVRSANPKLHSRRARSLAARVQRGAWKHGPSELPTRKRKFDECGLPYRLETLKGASLSNLTIRKGLQKKNADVKFLAEVFSAANTESGQRMSSTTRKLMRRGRESSFHRYFARSLPKVSSIDIPILVSKQKKRVGIRKCSCSAQKFSCVPIPVDLRLFFSCGFLFSGWALILGVS